MLDELTPTDLHGAAAALTVHPFEIVRLMVLSGASVDTLTTTSESLERLRTFGQMETWWEGMDALPEDDNERRRIVRGMLDAMVQRDLVGDKTTRLDNLWRGLPSEAREVAEHALMVLHELGHVTSMAASSGPRVAIHPDGLQAVKDIIARGNAPADLTALWAG